MHRTRPSFALLGILALALSVTAGLALGGVANAKKKKGKAGGTVDVTTVVNAPIPADTATTNGVLTSTTTVGGKKFQGTQIRDVNATIQTLGTLGPSPADNLTARLTAPNGATTWLIPSFQIAGISIGPLTLDDESPNRIATLSVNATTVGPPYVGTAQPNCAFGRGGCLLSAMDGGPVSGTWTLRVYDSLTPAETSNLVSWRIVAVAGKAFQTK